MASSSANQTPTPDNSPRLAVRLPGLSPYSLHITSFVPAQVGVGAPLSPFGVEVQVRSRGRITEEIRQDLAGGRLFGVASVVGVDAEEQAVAQEGAQEQFLSAVAPVPALDIWSVDDSPPPPYVLGTLSFGNMVIGAVGQWRIRVTLLRMQSGWREDGAVSVGWVESEVVWAV